MRPRRCLAFAALLFMLALPTASANAADTFGIRVIRGEDPAFLIFRSATCHVDRRNGFQAVAYQKGWRLLVRVRPFSGFHRRYALERGQSTGTFIDLAHFSSDVHYASDYVPPYPVAGGGLIDFSGNGGMMGAGFLLMFSEDGSHAVDVAGGLRCHYPHHTHRR